MENERREHAIKHQIKRDTTTGRRRAALHAPEDAGLGCDRGRMCLRQRTRVFAPEDACACAKGRVCLCQRTHAPDRLGVKAVYTCLCLIFGFATLLLFMLAAGCYGAKQPIATLAGSLCLVAAAALILVSLTRCDGVPLFGALAACTVGFHGPSTVALVSFFFVFEFFWRGRSLFNLPATWALPKDVAFQTAVRAFSATAFMLDSLAHDHEKFSAKILHLRLSKALPVHLTSWVSLCLRSLNCAPHLRHSCSVPKTSFSPSHPFS